MLELQVPSDGMPNLSTSLKPQVGLCSQGSLYLAQQSSSEPPSGPAAPRPIIEAFDLNFRVRILLMHHPKSHSLALSY